MWTSLDDIMPDGFKRTVHSACAQVIAHSVGTWNAFEFLHLARASGLPMPKQAFLSAMAAPDIPLAQRPWRQQYALSEAEFKVPLKVHSGWMHRDMNLWHPVALHFPC